LTIYIDLPVDVSLERLQERSLKEVYETKSKLTKVRQQYHQIFSKYKGKIILIDGTKKTLEIHQAIVDFMQNKLK